MRRLSSLAVKGVWVGAIAGVLLSVTPFELFVPALAVMLVCLPIVLFRKNDWVSGLIALPVSLITMGAIAAVAERAPFKWVDQRVGPFDGTQSLAEVVEILERDDVHLTYFPASRAETNRLRNEWVTMPSGRIPLREVFRSIEEQTGATVDLGFCGNGATLLRGSWYPLSTQLRWD